MLKYPPKSGKHLVDLDNSPDKDESWKHQGYKGLYLIETDTNSRDFAKPSKIYGVFFSSYGPDPVNKVAIGLWKYFNKKNANVEDAYNHDGSKTKEGQCYDGFATYFIGGMSLCLWVTEVKAEKTGLLYQMYVQKNLLRKALEVQGIAAKDMSKDEMYEKMRDIIKPPSDEAQPDKKRKADNDAAEAPLSPKKMHSAEDTQ